MNTPTIRVTCLLIPHLAVQLERLQHPELQGRPMVIGGAPHERPIVIDCSEDVRPYGVVPGMQLRQAFARCHHAVFLEARSAVYEEMNARIYKALYRFSPQVEIAQPGCFFVSLRGLSIRPDGELAFLRKLAQAVTQAVGLRPRAAVASGKFAAYSAAVRAAQPTVVPVQRLAEFVASLPAHHLPVAEEMKRQLRFLGLATLGDIAQLPKTAMLAEFGRDGQLAWELSHGIDTNAIRGQAPAFELRDQLTFEEPAATTTGLLVGVNVLLSRLGERLVAEGRGARGLRLRIKLTSRRIWQQQINFREATSNVARMLATVKPVIERQSWRAAAEEIEVTLWDVHPAGGTQPDLFAERNGARQRVEAGLRHLRARYGHVPVYHAVESNPLTRLSERRYALVAYDPDTALPRLKALGQPEPAEVRASAAGLPQAVLWHKRWLSVSAIAEEWRLEEEWWTTEISRRYFRAQLTNGAQLILSASSAGWQRFPVNEVAYAGQHPPVPRAIDLALAPTILLPLQTERLWPVAA